ncbi:kinesin light chain 1 [Acephala macrosclerotiorum]|nr:kinesin light chain 1 [Acephala macrosclerotiorum]
MIRLLQYNNNGEFSLTTFFADKIPQKYAILSHTWEAEEVTFEDLQVGTDTRKASYNKIRFCGEQAKRDGLQYFWVDTCCIDKSNSTELAEAINSMFRWYRGATRCYVYLSDVSRPPFATDDKSHEAFRESALSDFSVTERMSWATSRATTCKEDMAYSLLGIFDVNMPLIYGEGEVKALKRLREEIEKASKGIKREDFSVAFSLSNVSDIEPFVAREEELLEMHRTLSGDGSRRTVILHGLGGIGKTQLSVAYAKRHKDSYSAIFWLNIKDEDSLKQSFAKVARQISREHPSASRLSNVDTSENLDEVVDAVKAWLSLPHNTRWLMIYDNYDNPKVTDNMDPAAVDIQKFLSESYQGSVIITTRSSLVKIGHRIQITKLENLQDSLEILSNASNRKGLIKDPDAVRLAKELDGLPLALATAGAYLDQTAISLPDYLRLYKESWTRLKETSPQLSSYEDRTLYSTWQISFDYVKQRNPLSAKLLRLWAYFDSQDLWFELLRHSGSEDPEWIQELTEDELNFHDAVRALSNHGLVEVAMSSQEWIESKGYSIHGCVHSWTIHALNQEWDSDLGRLAVKFVGAHVPGEEDVRPWLTHRRLLQHAARCSYMVVNGLVADDGMAWAYHNLGNLYADQGKLEAAEQMYERALAGYEKALGADNATTYIPALNTIWCLGSLLEDKHDFANARIMYSKALVGFDKVIGPDHPNSRSLRDRLRVLDERMDNKALPGIKSHEQSSERPSHLGAKGTSQESKRNKLLKKIRFRFR